VDLGVVVGLVVAVLGAWLLLVVAVWLMRPRDVGLVELVRLVPDVLRLVRNLLTDRTVPGVVRIALVVLLGWLVNPIDLIPDFIPVLGPLDDVVVAIIILRYVRRRLGDEELRLRWPGTPEGYELLRGILR
jgi:uncharacterized membrane protein YkvA (DUF1232 family)